MPDTSAAVVRRTTVLLAAGVLALLLIIAGVIALATRADDFVDRVEEAGALRARNTEILANLRDAETGQRGFLLTGDEAYLEPFNASRAWLGAEAGRLRGTNGPNAVRVADAIEQKLAELDDTIALQRAGRRAEAIAVVRTDRGKAAMDELRRFLGERVALRDRQLRDALDGLSSTARWLTWATIIGALAVLAFGAGAVWLLLRYTRALIATQREVEALNEGLEERVRERTVDLSRANDEIQRFAYIVSHDLRSPLVNVMGFTSELETGLRAVTPALEPGAPDPVVEEARTAVREDMPEAIGFIRNSTAKMDRLINAILRLSREGRRELRPERVDLGAVLQGVAANVQHQADAAGARIEVRGGAPALTTDRLALEQVLGNLVDNAVKYLDRGRPGAITLSAERRRGMVEVTVADNGRGIAAGDLERVFELFRRAGVQDRPGEGIGLAHVRALARRLGGDVTVESVLGQGSRFRVSIPAVPETVPTGRKAA
ncbi:ATP-binding protein [Roseomonas sp. CCTCC AB2023176]|uniref:sensor histidine kinase n=1 Tax=Roseomonas sp. CCTCC AB2023176 TaxID=3342640 RepID=UPI0035E12343